MVAGAGAPALAHLYGEPLFTVPRDLYIPPDALEVVLESFQGPLDLLLYLIRKQNFNVMDIPMAELTRQYLVYVEQIRDQNLELAGDYLLMAALLIQIKSRMLLPARRHAEDEEPEDPRAELVRRLLEYEKMKAAAQELDALPRIGRDFHPPVPRVVLPPPQVFPDVEPSELAAAWAEVLKRIQLRKKHTITHEALSVREHMTLILRRLGSVRFLEFSDLFSGRPDHERGAAIIVVHFLAVLELARETLLEITQAEAYAPIYIRLSYTRATA